MIKATDILERKYNFQNTSNNDINDNSNISINDNNDISSRTNRFSLDKRKFTPNTPETQLAEKIAESFNDLNNYAFYLNVVNKIGFSNAESFWAAHLEEENDKKGTKYEFRSSKKYFAWKFKKRMY